MTQCQNKFVQYIVCQSDSRKNLFTGDFCNSPATPPECMPKLNEAKSCASKEELEEINTFMKVNDELMKYLCKDPKKLQEFMTSLMKPECLPQFSNVKDCGVEMLAENLKPDQACKFLDEITSCAIGKVKNHCDNIVSEFINGLKNAVISALPCGTICLYANFVLLLVSLIVSKVLF